MTEKTKSLLFSNNDEIEKHRKELWKVRPLKIYPNTVACALWKPEFEPKHKVGDVVKFYIGKTNVNPEDQKHENIRHAGIARVFGFYEQGYWIKILRYFRDEGSEVFKNRRYMSLHHNWVHKAPIVFAKLGDKLTMWSVS